MQVSCAMAYGHVSTMMHAVGLNMHECQRRVMQQHCTLFGWMVSWHSHVQHHAKLLGDYGRCSMYFIALISTLVSRMPAHQECPGPARHSRARLSGQQPVIAETTGMGVPGRA